MERWQKVSLAVLSALALVMVSFGAGYTFGGDSSDFPLFGGGDSSSGSDVLEDAYDRIRTTAVDPPSEEELTRGAIKGMVEALKKGEDPYALFYSPQSYKEFQNYTTGQFSGIGVWLKNKGGTLEIVSVLPSTPALEAGLKSGDRIIQIDGKDASDQNVDEAVTRIKGPEGTDVRLTVERDGSSLDFTITRQAIELPNLQARVQDSDLGYVRLFGFARGAGKELQNRVKQMIDKGVEGVVLDLRDNGGGLFSEAIEVASVFLEGGEVVTYKERSEPEIVYEAEGAAFDDLPLVVLVNEGTASASEIVAGAFQDRDRAILVGSKTFGKGSVQEVFPLGDASALKFTTGAYETPAGRDINGKGIEPDVEVAAEPNVQKTRAIEILKGIVISTTGAQG